ncbi:DNA-binding MarR family transcriptional regulator [Motilibacter peucedani]|uniref:DNA-binding MarR family transcriptional regulator n=2 Tax=Motilibacter peucedani TaxID=598650 RepID=A0A420XLR5_9ACTN|nr:DNA-binding MarR family transcriptional regulator [Motilibacter peucedani]
MAARLRLVVGRLNRRMRAEGGAGLSHLPLSALVSIERSGPIRLGELAAKEGVSAPTMSRALLALDERGAVERTTDPTDARSVLLTISPAGRELLATVREHYTSSLARLLSRLDGDQLAAVEAALPALEALIGEDPPAG